MSPSPPQLRADLIRDLSGPDYTGICDWPFPSEPFYVRQVGQMLRSDIPKAVALDMGRVWLFRDPQCDDEPIGFGILSIASYYAELAGKPHPYIPLLALRPGVKSRGYGQAIVEHLVSDALLVRRLLREADIAETVYLDVYRANEKACNLYTGKCGFEILNLDDPIPDPRENNEPYYVMARSLSIG